MSMVKKREISTYLPIIALTAIVLNFHLKDAEWLNGLKKKSSYLLTARNSPHWQKRAPRACTHTHTHTHTHTQKVIG
jgi:hypothetical protein